MSMAQACRVLIRLMPSAPAASTALHMATMSSACGLSFTIRGLVHTLRTLLTTSEALSALTP